MSDSDSGNDNELPSNSGKLTVKGLPDHLKEGVRREQNRISAQRARDKRREEYFAVCAAFLAEADKLTELEKRVDGLVKVLEDAGVYIPPNTAFLVQESILAAQESVSGSCSSSRTNNPDNEELFEEIMAVLDNPQQEDNEE